MNFDIPSNEGSEAEKDQEREKIIAEVKAYFEDYVTEAENADYDELGEQDAEDVYTDLTRIKGILEDMKGNDFSTAYEYLDEEVTRFEKMHEKMEAEQGPHGDQVEGHPYREYVTKLRDSLILPE